MELLNNIWSALTTPNETLINIILIPCTIIEVILTLCIFTTIFNIKSTTKQNIIYTCAYSAVMLLTACLVPSPLNVLINYFCMFFIIKFTFKLRIFQSIISTILPTIFFALIGTLIMNPYFRIFHINYDMSEIIPIYRMLYLFFMYLFIICIIILFKLKKYKFKIPDITLDGKSKHS